MKTYQAWSETVPMEYIDAETSFAARIEFAKRHKLVVTDCMARAVQNAGFPDKPQYFSGPFGDVGIVVYLSTKRIAASWSVWMVPGSDDGM